MKSLKTLALFALLAFFFACDSGPKVIESEPVAGAGGSAVDQAMGHDHPVSSSAMPGMVDEHKAVAEEVLHTDKYTYVRVNENGQSLWIAVPKTNVELGKTYYYKGGLEKKNFQSREFNRVFETLYLVSGLSAQPVAGAASAAGSGGSAVDAALSGGQNSSATAPPTEAISAKGSVKIADLMGNLSKYDGKTIRVTGKVMKVNPMIMGRNWVHLQDGTANNFDLTITTMEQVQLGSVVTLEGTVALNKDFGAGYRYNVILEGAVAKQ